MVRCLSVFMTLTAFLLIVPSAWVQDKQKEGDKAVQKKNAVDLEAIFKKLDANGDGKIDLEEFKKLSELYKLTPVKGGKGNFDPAQLQKLLEGIGGQGNLDPETLKKLFERIGNKGGGGGLDLKKLKDKLGKGGDLPIDLDMIRNLLEQLGVQGGGDFDLGNFQELIQNLIGGGGLEKKLPKKDGK